MLPPSYVSRRASASSASTASRAVSSSTGVFVPKTAVYFHPATGSYRAFVIENGTAKLTDAPYVEPFRVIAARERHVVIRNARHLREHAIAAPEALELRLRV